ncbi:MAG: ribosomal RNA small subunit methyltransferase A [Deltaproteobacteria bacterium CG11_big_fil_rev_8_21_14_0_20_47_16]|nr:MAG: ribosomal RNA small subunit methyltransferase A [Deltaproteobacteria bacterium CG11_big_fil_rev_8_21_14_0_20_47_16]
MSLSIPRPKKSLGQNFLFDKNILEKMIRMGKITADLPVLEIGPGPGELTQTLLNHGCVVVAIETDRDMVTYLQNRFKSQLADGQLTLIKNDILREDWARILTGNKPWQVVGNIPYNISTEILFRFIDQREHCECGMFMVQKEVAERVAAKHNNKAYGVLSIAVQLATTPKLLFTVGRKSFTPPPKVDSAVLFLDCLTTPFPADVYAPTMKIVRKAFQQRRKTLRNALSGVGASAESVDNVFTLLSISPKLRPENLSLADWVALGQQLRQSS